MNIKTAHKEYVDMEDRWKLCRAEYEGEHGMHEEGERFLPRLHEESDTAYAARLKMTPFFNAYYRTIVGLKGMLFRRPPKIEVPPAMVEMAEDIDLAGTTLKGLTQDVADESLAVGRVGLLVDYPETIPGATRADAVALNYRPMIKLYKTEAIYNWRTDRVNGSTVLTRVQLEECEEVVDAENEFNVKDEKRYRILDLVDGKYRQRVFKHAADANAVGEVVQVGNDIFPTMNGANMDFIPFVFVGADCIGSDIEAPPMIDLATTNLHHYMQATSYERGCFFSGLPTMFVSGVEADGFEIAIGGSIANILPRPDSKAWYVEVVGKFEALRTNLEDKKREMAVLGARVLEQQKSGVEAADAIARRQSGEESVLASISMTISDGVTRALRWFAEWAGANGEVYIELNQDFLPAGMTSQDIAALVSAWQEGAISQETLFDNLKAGEIIHQDITFEEEQERIAGAMIGMTAPQPMEPVDMEEAEPMSVDTSAVEEAVAALTAQHQAMFEQITQALATIAATPAVKEADTAITDKLAMLIEKLGQPVEPPVVNVAAPVVNVPAPVINMPEQQAPTINVAPPSITVESPVINMPEQPITINMPEQQSQPLTVNTGGGNKRINIKKNPDGSMTAEEVENE